MAESIAKDCKRRILADTWYSHAVEDSCTPFDELLRDKYPQCVVRLANRSAYLRGLLLFWLGRSYSLIVTSYDHRGARVAMVLEALFHGRSRRVVILELIRAQNSMDWWKDFPRSVLWRLVLKPAIRRTMMAGQVLTNWEREHYSKMLGVPIGRLFYIPCPLRYASDQLPAKPRADRLTVMSSGRVGSDWETLFKAHEGASWPLTVICSKLELPRVTKLNTGQNARILCDVPLEEHEKELRDAGVYALCVRDRKASAGHIRIRDATRVGTPVIVCKVKGLEGYVVDGETGLVVEPGDPVALRAAIESLVADPRLGARLAENAFERASGHTSEKYIEQIRTLISACADGCPPSTL